MSKDIAKQSEELLTGSLTTQETFKDMANGFQEETKTDTFASQSQSVEQQCDKAAELPISPPELKVKKRHIRILGTLNKKASKEFIEQMVQFGMDGCRVFCDYGYDNVANLIQYAREAAEKNSTRVVINIESRHMSKLFLGETENDKKIFIKQGDILKVTTDEDHIASESNMTIGVRHCLGFKQQQIGSSMFFDMGSIVAIVKSWSKHLIECEAQNEGWIYENQTIVFGSRTDKNQSNEPQIDEIVDADDNDDELEQLRIREDVRFILQNDIDYVIHSITQNHQEVIEIRKVLAQETLNLGPLAVNKNVRIMAKLENMNAIKDINKILEVSDAILVPRGQLGTVLPIEKISWIQKNIIRLCNYQAKPVILASQFLDSMVLNPFPLRAEVSDIHAATIDGADGLLLNAETQTGEYPLESLMTMTNICLSAEQHFPHQEFFLDMLQKAEKPMKKTEAVANSVVKSAFNLHSPVILAETDTGVIPRMISKYRPFSQVVAIYRTERNANAACLARSMNALYVSENIETTKLIKLCIDMLKKSGAVESSSDIVFVSGVKDDEINSQFQIKFIQIP